MKPAKAKKHQFDLLQSVTVIYMPHPNKPHDPPATIVRVYRDENVMRPGYVLDNDDIHEAIAKIDAFYRREIALAVVDLPRVRRVEVTDQFGTGIVIEN
jgi:hypothetical protein